MAVTAQLNARMSRELKTSGDRVLAEAGISPTKLVRLVWEKVASGGDGLRQLLWVLQSDETLGQEFTRADGHTNVETRAARGEQLFVEGVARLGLSQEAARHMSAFTDWKALREDAVADRLSERGIL